MNEKTTYKTENRKYRSQFIFGLEIHVPLSRFIFLENNSLSITIATLLFLLFFSFFFLNTLVKIRARCVLLEARWRREMQNTPMHSQIIDPNCGISYPWGSKPVLPSNPQSPSQPINWPTWVSMLDEIWQGEGKGHRMPVRNDVPLCLQTQATSIDYSPIWFPRLWRPILKPMICCSITKSCLTLCNPMDCSLPGFPVLHPLPEFAQTQAHRVGDAIQSSHPLSTVLLLPSIFPSIRVFSNESAPRNWSSSISPSNEYSGLISFRIDWFHLHAVQGSLTSLLQYHSSKADG